jgi:DNA-binding transcriptional LysR family regulator
MAMTIDREDLELRLLRTFLAVVRHGRMGRAAAEVAKTQPAVSQQILRLETIVGRKLFSRSRDGVKLTGHGELLVAYANRAIDLNEEALARLREEFVSGPVRLGVSEETVLARLTPTLKRFQRTYPDVELKLTVASPAKLEFLLAQGDLDFIISDPARIAGQPVIEWRSHLAWFAGTDLCIDPFCPLPLVLSQNAASWRDQILDSLRRAGWEWRIVLESANLETTIAAVESDLGVSALLRETVRNTGIREVKHGRLPVLPEISFGLFRSNTVLTTAQSLMEMALTASLKSAKAQRLTHFAEPQTLLSSDEPKPERMTIS